MKDFDTFMTAMLEQPEQHGRAKVSSEEFGKMFNPFILADSTDPYVIGSFLADMDYSKIEERILGCMVAGKVPAVIVGLDTKGGRSNTALMTVGVEKDHVLQIIFCEDVRRSENVELPTFLYQESPEGFNREIGPIVGMRADRYIIEELIAMERDLPPLAQDAEEPVAKNGMKASKKTSDAKAKLPFYHKNRRF
ncbi:hypothetical protein [Caballeronia sp. TF1N1]|uniref:hypothetical protein n=1 Tax=Caballeronia sp. TF1N1 TaxID=2878153 RepID=UPI001FCF97EF|nr:hypothetical protein [Caballeronia sp. TF1N1]